MTIVTVAESDLDADTEARISVLLDLCFDGGFEGRSHFLERPHLRVLWRENGRIQGHAGLGFRLVRQGERLLGVATLAEVAVHPDDRGRGIGGALVSAALAPARRMRARYMLLYSVPGTLYARAGFRPVANAQRRVDFSGRRSLAVVEGDYPGLMVLPLTDEPWDEETTVDLLGGVF